MSTIAGNTDGWTRALLVAGILGPLLQAVSDRLAGTLFGGYDFSAQSMSDLSASGSPVRPLVVLLTAVATVIMLAFAAGIWRATPNDAVTPRIVAALVAGNALFGLVATVFFPNRLGERPLFGTPGVILMFISVLCFVLAMIVGAVAFGGWMRMISIGIPALYVVLAVLRFAAAGPSSEQAASMMGAQERTMGFSYLAWAAALAVYLLTGAARTGG